MKDLRRNIILMLCLIPFFRAILRFFYSLAIKKVKMITELHPEIKDIFLTSKMSDHDFIYGSSNLNLIFVVNNGAHPREVLKNVRKTLYGIWPVNMLVDLDNLHVLKEIEIQTPLIRSCLNVKRPEKNIRWKSILSNNLMEFSLKEQDHFAIQRTYVSTVEDYLLFQVKLRMTNRHWIRSFGKNIYRSIKGLYLYGIIKSHPGMHWEKYVKKLIGFSWFSRLYYMTVKIITYDIIDFEAIPKAHQDDIPKNYPERLTIFCEKILTNAIVEDIILSPALIQLNSHEVQDKIFVELILGQTHTKFTAESVHSLSEEISTFLRDSTQAEPKYVFRFNTYAFMKLKARHMLSEYPLEHSYRYQNSHSFMNIRYQFTAHNKQFEKASIHYLLRQFMQFRSMEHKNHLIGSRFIKSLNIIYRYQLLLDHLKGKEFAVSHSYRSIMENLTPQLSHIKPDDRVSEELWDTIRAQMLFLLKKIRDELAIKNPSLKNLQF